MFLFGLITILQGFTQNLSGLIATRFFLGFVETGVFPACFYLIAMWYKRSEAQKRYSFFFSSTTLAGGFGGLLASAIGKMDGLRGYRGWRWIFILGKLQSGTLPPSGCLAYWAVPAEGAATVLISFILYFTISDFPEEAKWLSQEEKEFVKARLYEDVGSSRRDEPLTAKSVLAVFKDCKYPSVSSLQVILICYCREDHRRRLHVLWPHRPSVWLR